MASRRQSLNGGGGGGRRAGGDNVLWLTVGAASAVILDYVWNSTRLPGWNSVVGAVSKKGGRTVPITAGDWIQMSMTALAGAWGHVEAPSSSKITPWAFGMTMTQLITKFGFPTFGVPRYIIYDIDSQGRLVPTAQLR